MARPVPRARLDREAALALSPLFRSLPDEARQSLALAGALREVEADNAAPPLCRRGEPSQPVIWLLIGEGEALAQVSFESQSSRRSRLGYRLMGGELAGDIDLLLAGMSLPLPPRSATIRALRPHHALELPVAALVALADQHPGFRRRLVRDAARRLAGLVGPGGAGRPEIPDLAFATAVLDLFDDLGDQSGTPREELGLRLSQQQVADLLGISLRSFSARATAWAARGLLDTAPLRLLDRERVTRIALAATLSPRAALASIREGAAQLIRAGDRLRGAAMAADGLELWPDNPGLLYLVALALARAGDGRGAAQILGHPALDPSGPISALRDRVLAAWRKSLASWPDEDEGEDEAVPALGEVNLLCQDIAALQARLAKDQALALPDGPARGAALRQAAALYVGVDASSPSAFAAVNAASLLAMAGDREPALRLARRADALAAGDGTWDQATRAEAALLAGNEQAALAAYRGAVDRAPAGDVASMRRQLSHLAAAGVAGAAECLRQTSPGVVLVVSGPVLARGSAPEPVLMAAAAWMQDRLAQRIGAGGIERLVVSLASGADLLAVELAVKAGIPVDAVLPFPVAEFRRTSVGIGGGQDWQARFDRLLPDLRSLTVLWEGPVPPSQANAHYARANRAMLGEALLAARSAVSTAEILAIGQRPGAAATLADLAETLGLAVTRIGPPPGLPPPRPSDPRAVDPFAPVLFAHAVAPTPQLRGWLDREGFQIRPTKSRRLLAVRLMEDLRAAAQRAVQLAPRAVELGCGIVLDHGAVLRRSGGPPDPEGVARMAADQAALPALTSGVATASATAALTLAGEGFAPDRLAGISYDVGRESGGDFPVGSGSRRLFRIY